MKKILIADDHAIVRMGVKVICEREMSAVQFGEAVNFAEVFQRLKENDWDLLILDNDMPGGNAFNVLNQLKANNLKVPVLVFSFRDEEKIALRALKGGAAGYLNKNAANQELGKAIDQILNGRKYVSQSLSEKLLMLLDGDINKEPHELLSTREFQILLLIATGKTVTEIAETLCLSLSTISTYRARMIEKLNLKSNAELTAYAFNQKLQ